MPSDEGKQVLKLLADGKIDVEQAFRLLRALGDIDERPRPASAPPPPPPGPSEPPMPPGARGRILRIRVTENGQQKVNVAIPLAIARVGKMKLASSGLVRGHLAKFGIDRLRLAGVGIDPAETTHELGGGDIAHFHGVAALSHRCQQSPTGTKCHQTARMAVCNADLSERFACEAGPAMHHAFIAVERLRGKFSSVRSEA